MFLSVKHPSGLLLSLALLTACLPSCSIKHAVVPTEPTKFLTSTGTDTSQRIARLPFEHSWRDPSVTIADYKNIIVRPVTTRYLRKDRWERSKSVEIPNQRAFERRAEALARHFTKQLNIAFYDPICIFYKTTDASKPNTLILEVALTEVHFPDPAKKPLDVPMCGFESRVRDARTGKLVSTASDRRGPDLHIGNDKAHITDNREICSIWARQLMEASNKEIFANVRRKLITVDPSHSE